MLCYKKIFPDRIAFEVLLYFSKLFVKKIFNKILNFIAVFSIFSFCKNVCF